MKHSVTVHFTAEQLKEIMANRAMAILKLSSSKIASAEFFASGNPVAEGAEVPKAATVSANITLEIDGP